MRVLVDTNVFISALLSPHSVCNSVLENITKHHELLLCDYIIDECFTVANRKFPEKLVALEAVFTTFQFERIPASDETAYPMNDINDQPILNAAVHSTVDVLVTGDNHFLGIEIENPEILTPKDFLTKYGNL